MRAAICCCLCRQWGRWVYVCCVFHGVGDGVLWGLWFPVHDWLWHRLRCNLFSYPGRVKRVHVCCEEAVAFNWSYENVIMWHAPEVIANCYVETGVPCSIIVTWISCSNLSKKKAVSPFLNSMNWGGFHFFSIHIIWANSVGQWFCSMSTTVAT